MVLEILIGNGKASKKDLEMLRANIGWLMIDQRGHIIEFVKDMMHRVFPGKSCMDRGFLY